MLDAGIERGQSYLDGLSQQAIDDANQEARAERQGGEENAPEADDKPERRNTAKELIELALKHGDLFHDERSDGYFVVRSGGVRRTLKLRSREFKRWQAGTYYAETGKAANNEAASAALSVLEAKATFDGRMLELSNRFAMIDGDVYFDMADAHWRVIKVTAFGWEVLTKPPVLFRRYSHQQALPDPIKGGRLSDIHRHLAIKSDDDKLLTEAWLVACAFPSIPRPAITFHGPQGASKTTTARILKALTDPSLTESVDLGKSPSDLAQVLDHHGIPCFDNMTSIPGWAADMLCRGVTGGAFSKRELYSDESDVILSFKRPMIVTGINIPTHAPDLLDRLLLIELERISTDRRMDETTFWAQFNADKPKLFGALLTALAGTLKHLPAIKLDRMPRMADFAKIACAYAEHSGVGTQKMLDVIMAHTSRQTEEALDSDPVASAVREFVEWHGTWTGTAKQMLEELNEKQPTPKPDGWPKQANSLSKKLNVLHATLNEVGISIRRHKEGASRERKLTLESRGKSSSLPSASSNPNVYKGFGADDGRKAPSAASSAPSAPTSPDGDTDGADDRKDGAFSLPSALNPSVDAGCDDADGKDDQSPLLSGSLVEVEV